MIVDKFSIKNIYALGSAWLNYAKAMIHFFIDCRPAEIIVHSKWESLSISIYFFFNFMANLAESHNY